MAVSIFVIFLAILPHVYPIIHDNSRLRNWVSFLTHICYYYKNYWYYSQKANVMMNEYDLKIREAKNCCYFF
jgi:hypothetical protein